jgi:hypothetical protein
VDVTLTWAVLLSAGGIIAAIGLSYGDLRARVSRIEKKLGNGTQSTFITREEVALMREKADSEHHDIFRRLGNLEK